MAVDWGPVEEVCKRRAWMLEESDYQRPGFDDLTHTAYCNVNPSYHQGREEVWKRGCDCGALKQWRSDSAP